jgi:hypothetical protein
MTPGRGGALLIDRRERLLAIGALGAPVCGRDGPGATAARAGLGAGAAAGPGAIAALPGCGRAARTPPRLQLALELALVRGPLLCAALAVGVARVEVRRGGAIGGVLRRRRRSACGPLRSTQSRVATSGCCALLPCACRRPYSALPSALHAACDIIPSRTGHGSSNSRMNAAPQASLGTGWLGRCTYPTLPVFAPWWPQAQSRPPAPRCRPRRPRRRQRPQVRASPRRARRPPPHLRAPPCAVGTAAPPPRAPESQNQNGTCHGVRVCASLLWSAAATQPTINSGVLDTSQVRPAAPARTERGAPPAAARRRAAPAHARWWCTQQRGAHVLATCAPPPARTPLRRSRSALPRPAQRPARGLGRCAGRPERQLWWQVCLTGYSLALTPCTLRRADACCTCSDAAPCLSARHSNRVLRRRLVEARIGTEDHYTQEGFAQWVAGRGAHIGDGGLVQRQPARVKRLDVIGRLLHGRRRHVHGRACCPAQCLSELHRSLTHARRLRRA